MTLKATLLVCISIVISEALVSCVIGPKEILQPSVTSMVTSMFFFMRIILCCHTSSLLMKHANALESNNALVSIVMDPLLRRSIKPHLLTFKNIRCPSKCAKYLWVLHTPPPPYLIVIGNEKQGVGFEGKLRPFWTHDTSKSSLVVPLETRHPCFPSL
jgi:hypothetical protein